MDYNIRKAKVKDIPIIYNLLKKMSVKGLLLPRSLSNLYEMIQCFWVAENSAGEIKGTAALQIIWEDLAEVRSLAVDEDAQSTGLGKKLTAAVELEAMNLGFDKVFVLTYVPVFFKKLNYQEVSLDTLPQKIWSVCFNCVHYPDCQEVALIKYL